LKNEILGHEIHLKTRPTGSVRVEDFELVMVEIPSLKEEGDFLVRNVWMSIDPFLRIYMVKGTSLLLLLNYINHLMVDAMEK
jgi:NADPH-dependent curcumin reductase CurA